MKQMLILFAVFLLCVGCSKESDSTDPAPEPDILTKLEALPGVATVTELPSRDHFNRVFELSFTQPVDHNSQSGATFTQKVYVGHVDENLPVVYETEGYSRSSFRTRELAPAMQSNQISVEHRYNGESKPSPLDWQYLTVKQAADDLHRIFSELKSIYPASWVSSGRSKGGDTAIFYRRFYPDDMEATVAFVAPILFSDRDRRINDYMDNAGTQECRDNIKSFQRAILQKKDSLAALLPPYIEFINTNFDQNFQYAFDDTMVINFTAVEFPFEFWSSTQHDCSTLPDSTANTEVIFNYLIDVMDFILFYTDYAQDFWQGWYYQAQTEIGDFRHDTEHLGALLGEMAEYYDFGQQLTFNPAVMQDIDQWMQSEAEKIILIYGEEDPWSAAQFSTGNPNVTRFINPGTKHETAVSDLSPADQSTIITLLTEWLQYSDFQFD